MYVMITKPIKKSFKVIPSGLDISKMLVQAKDKIRCHKTLCQ